MPHRTAVPSRYRDKLPTHAQKIFIEAFNNAWDQYADKSKRRGNDTREAVASKVAWKAVETKYEKGDDEKWHRKTS